jgi:hypothetical protein
VGARSKVDVVSDHRRLGGVEHDVQSSPTWRAKCQCSRTGGCLETGQVNDATRRSLQWCARQTQDLYWLWLDIGI